MRHLAFVSSVLLVFGFVGCSPSDQPDLGQVSGTVKLDGQPLVGVAVVFQPDNGRPARGITNAEGKYELTYIRKTLGAKVGNNRVEIAPSEGEDAEETEDADGQSKSAKRTSKSGKPVIPARYNTKSELKREVKSGRNTFDFDLTS